MGFLSKAFGLKRKSHTVNLPKSPPKGLVGSSSRSLPSVSLDSLMISFDSAREESSSSTSSSSSSSSRPSAVSLQIRDFGSPQRKSSVTSEIQPADLDDDNKENASRVINSPRGSVSKGKGKAYDCDSSPRNGKSFNISQRLQHSGLRKLQTQESFDAEFSALRIDDTANCSNSTLRVSQSSTLESPVSVLDVHKVQRSAHHRELADAFRIIDANGDGRISATELSSVARVLGVDSSDKAVQQMIEEVDKDGDGQIDLDEFVEYNTPAGKTESVVAELKAAFHVFDLDKNNFISAEELHQVLKGLGESTTMEECSRMIRGVDSDGDGHVNFDEFQKMMTIY